MGGDMLTLSADASRPTSFWQLHPATSVGSGASPQEPNKQVLLRSAIKNDIGPGKKFGPDGGWQAYPGWSVVCDLLEPSLFDSGRALVKSSVAWKEALSEELPTESLHMTVWYAAQSCIGKVGASVVKEALDKFALAVQDNGGVWACGVKVRRPSERLNMQLIIDSVEPNAAFAELRDALKAAVDLSHHEPKVLHVNLGWYWLWQPEDPEAAVGSLEAAYKEFESVLERNGRRVPLKLPHLAHYPDMAHFPQTLCQSATPQQAAAPESASESSAKRRRSDVRDGCSRINTIQGAAGTAAD